MKVCGIRKDTELGVGQVSEKKKLQKHGFHMIHMLSNTYLMILQMKRLCSLKYSPNY